MDYDLNRLRELRRAAGLSQQHVADAIGVSKVTISSLERGMMRLDTTYMARIAPVLGVLPVELLPRSMRGPALSADELLLLDTYRKLSMVQRALLHRLARAVLGFESDDQA